MPFLVRSTGTNFTNSDCIDDEEAAAPVDDDEDDEEEEEDEDDDDDIVQTLNSTNVRVRVINANV